LLREEGSEKELTRYLEMLYRDLQAGYHGNSAVKMIWTVSFKREVSDPDSEIDESSKKQIIQ
jgi:hypothetical protein